MKDKERVILVNHKGIALRGPDGSLRTQEKFLAHKCGNRHLAVSVFIFNSQGELLLQQRAMGKYHSSGQWTNTCCTHPRPGEQPQKTAERRLDEEMGITCSLEPAFTFGYRADVGNGLIEDEFDHVFMGKSDVPPIPNPREACGWKWMSLTRLAKEIRTVPHAYSPWLRICLNTVVNHRTQCLSQT
ncbi:MAG: isopentenyl-diphosphate Delta-isomerase [Desulfobacterium sp.]